MLIKGVTRKGDAIAYSAEEALKAAVERVAKANNTLDVVYWIDNTSIVKSSFSSTNHADGTWEAWAEGTVNVGKTITRTDEFLQPVPHAFKVHYRLTKDDWGLPDIILPTDSTLTPLERNPAKLAGGMPLVAPAQPLKSARAGKSKEASKEV